MGMTLLRHIHGNGSTLRRFLESEALGGVILMVSAALALVVANSPFAEAYHAALETHVGPLSVLHLVNDGLMAVFFLVVGLEIKRELLDGHLRHWSASVLPGLAALSGMFVPALPAFQVVVFVTVEPAGISTVWVAIS